MMKRTRLAALALTFAMAWTPVAMAQDTGGDPPPADGSMAPPPDDGGAPPPPVVVVDEPAPDVLTRTDGPRFRWGVSLQAGGLILPVLTAAANSNGSTSVVEETIGLGSIGVNGQVGVQINDMIGIVLKPAIDVLFDKIVGMQFGIALMVDFTFLDGLLSAGIGPDTSVFLGFGGSLLDVSLFVGEMYGARLHFAVHPVIGYDEMGGPKRKALSIGLDLRMLGGAVAGVSAGIDGASASAGTEFFFAPLVTIGYTAF